MFAPSLLLAYYEMDRDEEALTLLQSSEHFTQYMNLMILLYLRNNKPANAFMMLQQAEATIDHNSLEEDKHIYEQAFQVYCDLMIQWNSAEQLLSLPLSEQQIRLLKSFLQNHKDDNYWQLLLPFLANKECTLSALEATSGDNDSLLTFLHAHPLDPVSKRFAAKALNVNEAKMHSMSGFNVGGSFPEDRWLSSHQRRSGEDVCSEEMRRQTPFANRKTQMMMST